MTGAGTSSRVAVQVSKHHGWGNDFLVVDVGAFELSPGMPSWPELAQKWCDRRSGVGADGLLLLDVRGPHELGMVLHNADGSRAEMSGNGIRCLVQAAHHSITKGAEPSTASVRYRVETDAGTRHVDVLGPQVNGVLDLSVDMGTVSDIAGPHNWAELGCHEDRPVRHVSLGNPHAVVGVDDVGEVDLVSLGTLVPEINLEIVEPGPEPDAVTMRVHERGAGLTMACGTGACAVAEAALAWGLVPRSTEEVRVHMPGGEARVRIDAETRRATLIGPAVHIATVTVYV